MKSLNYNAATGERTWEDVPDSVTDLAPAPVSHEIAMYRRRYLDLTAQLCQLAGMPYTGKLSNVDYDQALQRASTHPPAGVIAATLVYCRTCLYELEGDQWWDNIGDEL